MLLVNTLLKALHINTEFLDQISQVIPAELNEADAKMYADYSCLELLPTVVENVQPFAKERHQGLDKKSNRCRQLHFNQYV